MIKAVGEIYCSDAAEGFSLREISLKSQFCPALLDLKAPLETKHLVCKAAYMNIRLSRLPQGPSSLPVQLLIFDGLSKLVCTIKKSTSLDDSQIGDLVREQADYYRDHPNLLRIQEQLVESSGRISR
jgi:hypothetical protein